VAGADGGTASSCGKDSNFSAAVTGNLTGPEMVVSEAASSGSMSLGVSDVRLGLQALDLIKYEESILTDKRLLYYTEKSGNILLNCQTKQRLLAKFYQKIVVFTQHSKMRNTPKLALYISNSLNLIHKKRFMSDRFIKKDFQQGTEE